MLKRIKHKDKPIRRRKNNFFNTCVVGYDPDPDRHENQIENWTRRAADPQHCLRRMTNDRQII
jgi:hypothetical protein